MDAPPPAWGKAVLTIRELLKLTAVGGTLACFERWQLTEENQWNQYVVTMPDGTRHAVSGKAAATAERKGLVRVER
jgi:hypothetical protein